MYKNHTNQLWIVQLVKCTTLILNPKVRDHRGDGYERIIRDVSINHRNDTLSGSAFDYIASYPLHLYLGTSGDQ